MYNRLVEDKKMRRTSLQVLLPHMPSSDSLISSSSPGPSSPPGELFKKISNKPSQKYPIQVYLESRHVEKQSFQERILKIMGSRWSLSYLAVGRIKKSLNTYFQNSL